jgi:Pyruvate/2-oxoacid:ferredoxin oxidoreductase delta subunit
MPIVKKVRKLGARGGFGVAARETSSARPQFVPKEPPCEHSCPNGTDVRAFLMALGRTVEIEEGFRQAFLVIAERNPLPAVCSRLCPHHCEASCNRDGYDGAVAVSQVERAVADFAIRHGWPLPALAGDPRHERVLVIGAGAAGLSAAYQLARRGHSVTLCDPHAEPGGELRYGFEAQRLPRAVLDAEIARILALGVTFVSDPACEPAMPRVIRTKVHEDGRKVEAAAIPAAIHFGRHAVELLAADIAGMEIHAALRLPAATKEQVRFDHYPRQARLGAAGAGGEPGPPDGALSPEQAIAEARRCLSCGACFECDNCWKFCPDQAVIKPLEKGQPYRFRLEFCQGCNKCAEECPSGFIEMR